MSSVNSIHLLKHEIAFPSKQYGWKGADGTITLGSIVSVPFNNIQLNSEPEDEVDSNVARFKNSLAQYINGDRTYYDAGSRRNRKLENFMTLLAETQGNKLELYLKPVDTFSKVLCSIFRNPVFVTKGTLQVCQAMSPSWSPFHHSEIEKRFNLEVILVHGQKVESQPDIYQLLDNSVPKHILEPFETRTIKLVLDISIEWRDTPNILMANSVQNGMDFQIHVDGGGDGIMKNLYENDSTKDLTIIAGNGTEVKCHRFIFTAHKSTALTTLASPNTGLKEATTRKVEMKDISEVGLSHFIRYLYGMKISTSDLSCDVALQLFQTAHKYEVVHLEETVSKLFHGKSDGWFTPDTVLELYYFARNLDSFAKLEEHALRMMIRMSGALRTCERYRELNPDEKEELHWKLIQLK